MGRKKPNVLWPKSFQYYIWWIFSIESFAVSWLMALVRNKSIKEWRKWAEEGAEGEKKNDERKKRICSASPKKKNNITENPH